MSKQIDGEKFMKNLLKLSLLVSAFIVGGLSADAIEVNGESIDIPDQMTLVNDLGVNANVEGKLYTPGSRYILNKQTLNRLNGSIRVEKIPSKEVGFIRYAVVPAGYMGIRMESQVEPVINLSDAFAPEAR